MLKDFGISILLYIFALLENDDGSMTRESLRLPMIGN